MSILLSRRAYTSCPKNYPYLNKKSPKTISKKVIVPFALVYHLKNILIHSCISKKLQIVIFQNVHIQKTIANLLPTDHSN